MTPLLLDRTSSPAAVPVDSEPIDTEAIDAEAIGTLVLDAETIDTFPYPFEHLGREFETVMGDVSLCCSTCCTCSSGGGRQQPR
ncbi:hypothetical protein [Planctomonas psychrotolerans]|uniref:hypothetical protein n=1 Tax=Planctomonas psychrotolerans TaxID=2528712 RepID=UPI0012388021|nr:hypothetical protein [Planctomonas psychrotolerans]